MLGAKTECHTSISMNWSGNSNSYSPLFSWKLLFFSIFKDTKCSSFDSFTPYKGLSCRATSSLIPAPHLLSSNFSPRAHGCESSRSHWYTIHLKSQSIPSLSRSSVTEFYFLLPSSFVCFFLHWRIQFFGIMLQYSGSDDNILQELLETDPVRTHRSRKEALSSYTLI